MLSSVGRSAAPLSDSPGEVNDSTPAGAVLGASLSLAEGPRRGFLPPALLRANPGAHLPLLVVLLSRPYHEAKDFPISESSGKD